MSVVFLCAANQSSDRLSFPEKEVEDIYRILHPLKTEDVIDIERTYGTSLEDLSYYFLEKGNKISIFHYAGHADSSFIFLQDGPVKTKILGKLQKLQLVFLNGCSTMGQVQILFESGVKAVIGTSVPVGDARAMKFAKVFYEALARGRTLREAFNFAKDILEADASFTAKSEIEIINTRGLALREAQGSEMPWNLFVAKKHRAVLNWRLYRGFPWQRWSIILIGILGLVFGLWQAEIFGRSTTEEVPIGPRIEVESPGRNLGKVQEGSIILDSIILTNTGDAPLLIERLFSQESWIETPSVQDTVGVEESIIIVIKIFTKNLKDSPKGTVNIRSNAKETYFVDYELEVIKSSTPPPRVAVFRGIIKDCLGNPLANKKIELVSHRQHTFSESNGAFQFELQTSSSKTFRVIYPKSANVLDTLITSQTVLELRYNNHELRSSLVREGGQAYAFKTVRLLPNNASTITDAYGRFVFPVCSDRSYRIEFRNLAGAPEERVLFVGNDQQIPVQ